MNDNSFPRYGATLYVPADHDDVGRVRGGSVAGLGTMVICLEDAVRDDRVDVAMHKLREHLALHSDAASSAPAVYVRPRSPSMAMAVAAMPGSEHLRGFVVPKATPETLPGWIAAIAPGGHAVMPTIETTHAFDLREVSRIRDQCVAAGIPIDMVRIGGNDILATINARRSPERTLYEGPLGSVVTCIVGAFAGTGIAISSPVLEHYADETLLIREIEQDIEHGILNKTAIHPRQVAIINNGFRTTAMEVAEAHAILAEDAAAVFGRNGSMCEPKTHASWARSVLNRHRQLGLASSGTSEAMAR